MLSNITCVLIYLLCSEKFVKLVEISHAKFIVKEVTVFRGVTFLKKELQQAQFLRNL